MAPVFIMVLEFETEQYPPPLLGNSLCVCISKPTHVRAKRKDTKERAKEEVALEALTGVKTHAQIASDYGICPNLVKDWRKRGKKMPGKREFELDWLSKKPRSWDCSAASPTPGYK